MEFAGKPVSGSTQMKASGAKSGNRGGSTFLFRCSTPRGASQFYAFEKEVERTRHQTREVISAGHVSGDLTNFKFAKTKTIGRLLVFRRSHEAAELRCGAEVRSKGS